MKIPSNTTQQFKKMFLKVFFVYHKAANSANMTVKHP